MKAASCVPSRVAFNLQSVPNLWLSSLALDCMLNIFHWSHIHNPSLKGERLRTEINVPLVAFTVVSLAWCITFHLVLMIWIRHSAIYISLRVCEKLALNPSTDHNCLREWWKLKSLQPSSLVAFPNHTGPWSSFFFFGFLKQISADGLYRKVEYIGRPIYQSVSR